MINTSFTRRRSMVSSPPPGIEMLVSQGEKYLIDSEDDIRWGVSRLDNWPDITNTYITRSAHYMKMKAQSEEGLNMKQRRTSGLSPLLSLEKACWSWLELFRMSGEYIYRTLGSGPASWVTMSSSLTTPATCFTSRYFSSTAASYRTPYSRSVWGLRNCSIVVQCAFDDDHNR